MLDPAAFVAEVAGSFSAEFGGPYWSAKIYTQDGADLDGGGSLVTEGDPIERTCSAQVDAATVAMRAEEGFTEGDRRLLVLAATLEGTISTDDMIEILEGPFAGSTWSIQSGAGDACATYHELRARPA